MLIQGPEFSGDSKGWELFLCVAQSSRNAILVFSQMTTGEVIFVLEVTVGPVPT